MRELNQIQIRSMSASYNQCSALLNAMGEIRDVLIVKPFGLERRGRFIDSKFFRTCAETFSNVVTSPSSHSSHQNPPLSCIVNDDSLTSTKSTAKVS